MDGLGANLKGRKMEEVVIDYTNWRGERRERKVVPKYIEFGSSKHHPGQQWLLVAKDIEKGEDRTFAMDDIHSWRGTAAAERRGLA